MILSYHPILKGDRNLLCAGRDPNEGDFLEMRQARAILLPQGCRRSLFDAAARFCPRVFPDYTCCFRYPGKLGDIELFRAHAFPHPESWLFSSVSSCPASFWDDLSYPIVLKGNYGGEGSMVFELKGPADRVDILEMFARMERAGYGGFLVQEKIETLGRDLRVVVMGDRFHSYWRVQRDGANFYHNVSRGAEIDKISDPELQAEGIRYVRDFCLKTGINLAGLDLLFRCRNGEVHPIPLFLEINYYFGRKGLGGSEEYYKLLRRAVDDWLEKQLDITSKPRRHE